MGGRCCHRLPCGNRHSQAPSYASHLQVWLVVWGFTAAAGLHRRPYTPLLLLSRTQLPLPQRRHRCWTTCSSRTSSGGQQQAGVLLWEAHQATVLSLATSRLQQ